MATFRNDTGDDLTIDRYGLFVPAGATFEIPDTDADSLDGYLSIVRIASDVPAQIALSDEVLRDLVEVAGYSIEDLGSAAAAAPEQTPEEAPASSETPTTAAEETGEPAGGTSEPAGGTSSAPEVASAPAEETPTPADETPAAAQTEALPVEAGDLDSFVQL